MEKRERELLAFEGIKNHLEYKKILCINLIMLMTPLWLRYFNNAFNLNLYEISSTIRLLLMLTAATLIIVSVILSIIAFCMIILKQYSIEFFVTTGIIFLNIVTSSYIFVFSDSALKIIIGV